MQIKFRFDPEKAVEVILYIAKQVPDIYHVLKILYFADKVHLQEYGRFICGDIYVAMKHGPVPSNSYNIVQSVRDDNVYCSSEHAKECFQINPPYDIQPFRDADTDLFSDSDIECLDAAIAKYGLIPFGELKKLSHDSAYKSADRNDFIPIENIISTFKNPEPLMQHLTT